MAALTPSVFVAKSEVKAWPVFGWFARLAGTVFVNRNKPSRAAHSADEVAVALRQGALVVLFPEGTRLPLFRPSAGTEMFCERAAVKCPFRCGPSRRPGAIRL